MVISIKLHTIKSEWSIVYIEGSQVLKNVFFSLKIDIFVLTNSTDPGQMLHGGSSLFTKVKVYGFPIYKRYNTKGDNISTKRAST